MILKNVCFYNELFEKDVADIKIENGKIAEIGIFNEKGTDKSGLIALPGFVDVHIHGAGGGDASDASPESLDKITKALAKNGVTSFCPTTMTLSKEQLLKIMSVTAAYKSNGAKIAGINLEGPFISYAKKGAQNGEFIRKGTIEEFDELYNASKDLVKLITIAPEAFESDEFIQYVSKKCSVSIGHTSADADETRRAVEMGANHFTHLYNAMTPMNHRSAGVAGTALDSNAFCEIICDGGHICPAVLRNTFKILGENRAVVISDSMRAAGLGEGEFELGGQQVFVRKNGKYAVLEDGTIAASISNVYEEFKNLLSFGIDFKAALKSCTINPARSIGADGEIGSIAVGKCADMIFVDEDLNLKEVMIDGRIFA